MEDLKEIVEDENKISTVIADDIEFRGRLVFKNSLKIKGFFEGKIETKGHLIVGQEATVSADIKANVVSVNGIVNGKIKAAQRIELFNKSVTRCDIVTPELFIEKGSQFNGTCIMTEK
jgi:cytoskeletal protein CcmA (bactofilin family)